MLFPAAIRHRVPGGQTCCWFIESDPIVFFFFIQTRFIPHVPLGSTVAFTASICLLVSSSAIADIRGAKAGASPLRRIPSHFLYKDNIAVTRNSHTRIFVTVVVHGCWWMVNGSIPVGIRAVIGFCAVARAQHMGQNGIVLRSSHRKAGCAQRNTQFLAQQAFFGARHFSPQAGGVCCALFFDGGAGGDFLGGAPFF